MKSLSKIKLLYLVPVFLFMQPTCSSKYGMERFIKPVERSDTEVRKDDSALIRSIHCDLYLEPIDDKKWKKLLTNSIFINPTKKSNKFRIPKLLFFHVIIKNFSTYPITISDIHLKYGNEIMKSLSIEDIAIKTKSKYFSLFNFNNLLSTRRLLNDKYTINDIDYDNDTLDLKLNFIPSSDKAIQILAFNWIPVECREFKLIFTLKVLEEKKIIDFDFRRIEYRTKGEFFLLPEIKKEQLK